MVNYLNVVKLTTEIESLAKRKQKNYCFIIAENIDDEVKQIMGKDGDETTFIIVRKDKWQKEKSQKR